MTTKSTPDSQPKYSQSGHDVTPLAQERVQELARKLDPEAYEITQRAGTEPPGCSGLLKESRQGLFACVVCGLPLFASHHKFESKTGWPSFYQPFDPDHVEEVKDRSHGMERTEVRCARCRSHLGHVFPDGPKPTGLRYCINSASLHFVPEGQSLAEESRPVTTETAYFAGGCFWGVEWAFSRIPGVLDATSGYQNGDTPNPTYEKVCSGKTGYAESVRVTFDPKRLTYEDLVRFFFSIHNPTTPNRQGPDVGSQYRSAIFTVGDRQNEIAHKVVRKLTQERLFGDRPIVTIIEEAGPFTPAEPYHQDYVDKTGRACHVDLKKALRQSGLR